jgi:uncharacterized DUF497 family protein
LGVWAQDGKLGVHCMYVGEFEWDAAKARSNLAKHGIDFADAVTALEDASALTIEELYWSTQ